MFLIIVSMRYAISWIFVISNPNWIIFLKYKSFWINWIHPSSDLQRVANTFNDNLKDLISFTFLVVLSNISFYYNIPCLFVIWFIKSLSLSSGKIDTVV